jgi:HEAT repeat protein
MRTIACIGLALVLGMGVVASATTADDITRWSHEAVAGSQETRVQAIKALGASGDVRAVQPLVAALQDTNTTIREHARAALRSLAQALRTVYRTVAAWIDTLLMSLGFETTAPLPPVERTQRVQRL